MDVSDIRDRLDIMDLFARYCFVLDARDGDGVANCFVEDGLFMSNLSGATRGREAIRQLTLEKKKRPPDSRRHFFLNPVIDLDGDRAAFKAYFLGTRINEGRTEACITGSYFGTLARVDGKWLFHERHMVTDEAVPSNWNVPT